jgi:nucleotide-binding universal stress UspA family protein
LFNKILVPLDGSELSLSVLPMIEDLARKLDASLVLFHAINPTVASYPGVEMWAADARLVEDEKKAATEFLEGAAKGLKAKGLKVSILVMLGPVVDEIVMAAKANNVDLIAMSTHGHSGVGRWIMGSVADAVVRRTHLPCLLLRPEQTNAAGGAG